MLEEEIAQRYGKNKKSAAECDHKTTFVKTQGVTGMSSDQQNGHSGISGILFDNSNISGGYEQQLKTQRSDEMAFITNK
jgi:hypothetical protein